MQASKNSARDKVKNAEVCCTRKVESWTDRHFSISRAEGSMHLMYVS